MSLLQAGHIISNRPYHEIALLANYISKRLYFTQSEVKNIKWGEFKRGRSPLFLEKNSPSPRVERGIKGVRLICEK
jgi:hypothetical protein